MSLLHERLAEKLHDLRVIDDILAAWALLEAEQLADGFD